MPETVASLDMTELLAHERWVVRLAAALIRDDAGGDVDDVVQEARVSFWRRGPRDRARVRSWLGTVVRNLVRSRARDERRRRRQADELSLAAAGEAAPSSEELARRLEGHRMLATAVAELREPYRSVILLRYYEGYSGAQIAGRLGVPAGTVRWRLKTALDELRARLDDGDRGQDRRWRALVMMLAGGTRYGRVTPGVVGAGAALVVAAVILLATSGSIGSIGGRGPTAAGRGGAARGRVAHPASAAGRVPTFTVPQSPEETATQAGGEVPGWAVAPGFPSRAIAGKVVTSTGPVAGAELRLSAGMLTHARSLDRATRSGADGAFSFPPQPATNWFLTATAPGLAPQILYVDLRSTAPKVKPRLDPPDRLTIELDPCDRSARGMLRDEGGGVIAGGVVAITAPWNNGGPSVRTDGRGRYQVCLPRPGAMAYALVARADGYGTVETLVPAASPAEIDFTLAPAATVAGLVVRDGDGAPLPNVKVTLRPLPPANPNSPPAHTTQPVRLETTTDQDGRFQIGGLATGAYGVQAKADGIKNRDDNQRLTVSAGARLRDLEVRVVELASVEGTLLRGGSPAPDVLVSFEVRGIPAPAPGHSARWPWAITGPGGGFQVQLERGAVVDRVLGPWPRNRAPAGFTVDRPRISGVLLRAPVVSPSP